MADDPATVENRAVLRKRLKDLIPESSNATPFTKADEEELEKYRTKSSPYNVSNVCWLLASILVFHYLDVPVAILYDTKVNRTWLLVSIACLGLSAAFCMFCVLWLHWYKRVPSSLWDKQCPWLFPSTVSVFTVGCATMIRAVWPLWGFWSLPILFVEFMGIIVVIAMIPDVL